MSRRILRLCTLALALLTAICFSLQYTGASVELIRWDEPSDKAIGLAGGRLAVWWEPRVNYRPQWAGQVNRWGFRYNVYSDGSWYAWSPLWAPGTTLAVAALVTGYLAWRRCRRHAAGLCPACGYDLRATPERCPECGGVPTDQRAKSTIRLS